MLAGIILTPRTVMDALISVILKDLMSAVSMDIIWGKYWQIKQSDIHIIYPQLKDRPFYDNLVRNLTLGNSLFLLALGNSSYDTLKKVKGEFRVIDCKNPKVGGLRSKYWPCREIVNEKINHPDNDLFFEYRIHITDSFEETIVLMNLCVNGAGLEVDVSFSKTNGAHSFFLAKR